MSTASALLESARCLQCIPTGLRPSVITYLIDQWNKKIVSVPISWTPDTAVADWDDAAGAHSGDLATFLATADINTVSRLEFFYDNVTAIEHIEYLPNITRLIVSYNNLTTLDLSLCDSLLEVYLSYNNFATLDLNGCPNLQILWFDHNPALTAVDVSGCPLLQTINGTNCALAGSWDLTPNTQLVTVNVSYNVLTGLLLPATNTLITVTAAYNQLTGINVLSCPSLDALTVNDNLIVGVVDISNLALLTFLNVSFNAGLTAITSLNNTLLDEVWCTDCALTAGVFDTLVLVTLYIINNSLDSAAVDACLCSLDSSGAINGTVDFTGNAIWGGPGNYCRTSLIGKGWTVVGP